MRYYYYGDETKRDFSFDRKKEQETAWMKGFGREKTTASLRMEETDRSENDLVIEEDTVYEIDRACQLRRKRQEMR